MPRGRCLELKSLKEYLFSYRNLGIFQENIVNQVLEDVVKACDPVWAVVRGEFRPRGGIGTTVEARWPRPSVSGRAWGISRVRVIFVGTNKFLERTLNAASLIHSSRATQPGTCGVVLLIALNLLNYIDRYILPARSHAHSAGVSFH